MTDLLARSSAVEALVGTSPGLRRVRVPSCRFDEAGLLVFPRDAGEVVSFLRHRGIVAGEPVVDGEATARLRDRYGLRDGSVAVFAVQGSVHAAEHGHRSIAVLAAVPAEGFRLPPEVLTVERRLQRETYLGFTTDEPVGEMTTVCRQFVSAASLEPAEADYRPATGDTKLSFRLPVRHPERCAPAFLRFTCPGDQRAVLARRPNWGKPSLLAG
ncbi:hypothetical protein [Amycolatopsis sp. WQ 127309]|uniref:hypothetical protein n=1 Tax=Amycolatopsis sp. WQ 127309 TaxID=2932773 RepID=UPI001FF4A389|nr:hypothetical protein [Amycolatopsis sp. WQ 127309]UOZ06941.1 hypothetical protein MUY22_01200 [Amycolatopsis sp. WQ 127309]